MVKRIAHLSNFIDIILSLRDKLIYVLRTDLGRNLETQAMGQDINFWG